MTEIKINLNQLKDEMIKLYNEIEEFKPYVNSFIPITNNKLVHLHSNFSLEMKKTIVNMSDGISINLVEKLEQTLYLTNKLIIEFEKTDTNLLKWGI